MDKTMIILALIIGAGLALTGMIPYLEYEEDTRSWHIVWEGNLAQATEANPGAGAGGILEIFFYPHVANPNTVYAENNSAILEANSLGWANADDFNVQLPHSTPFDIVVRVRGNATQCKRGNIWWDSDLRVRITSSDLGIATDTVMTGIVTRNNSADPFLWMNFYINNTGLGYTLSKDQIAQITSIKFEAYY